MKKMTWVVLGFIALTAVGCAQKSESEKALDKMKADAKKASQELQKNIDNM